MQLLINTTSSIQMHFPFISVRPLKTQVWKLEGLLMLLITFLFICGTFTKASRNGWRPNTEIEANIYGRAKEIMWFSTSLISVT